MTEVRNTCTGCGDPLVPPETWPLCRDCEAAVPLVEAPADSSFHAIAKWMAGDEFPVPDRSFGGNRREYTYFMLDASAGRLKIGRTNDLRARLRAKEADVGAPLDMVGAFHGDVESRLHWKFAACRLRGEWFDAAHEPLREFVRMHFGRDLPQPSAPCAPPPEPPPALVAAAVGLLLQHALAGQDLPAWRVAMLGTLVTAAMTHSWLPFIAELVRDQATP